MLNWIDGGALLCQDAIVTEVKDLSEANVHVFQQLGAWAGVSVQDKEIVGELTEKEIEEIEQVRRNNAEKKKLLLKQIEELDEIENKLRQKVETHYQEQSKKNIEKKE